MPFNTICYATFCSSYHTYLLVWDSFSIIGHVTFNPCLFYSTMSFLCLWTCAMYAMVTFGAIHVFHYCMPSICVLSSLKTHAQPLFIYIFYLKDEEMTFSYPQKPYICFVH